MMNRVDLYALATEDRREFASGLNANLVTVAGVFFARIMAFDHLDQSAAGHNVGELQPAADAQHRQPAQARCFPERKLMAIAARIDPAIVAAGAGQVEILPPGEDQSVDRRELLGRNLRASNWQHDRYAAGALNSAGHPFNRSVGAINPVTSHHIARDRCDSDQGPRGFRVDTHYPGSVFIAYGSGGSCFREGCRHKP